MTTMMTISWCSKVRLFVAVRFLLQMLRCADAILSDGATSAPRVKIVSLLFAIAVWINWLIISIVFVIDRVEAYKQHSVDFEFYQKTVRWRGTQKQQDYRCNYQFDNVNYSQNINNGCTIRWQCQWRRDYTGREENARNRSQRAQAAIVCSCMFCFGVYRWTPMCYW